MGSVKEITRASMQSHAEPDPQSAELPVKGAYQPATISARTAQGGTVITASTPARLDGWRVACVGDLVSYPDGSTGRIVSGAGYAVHYMGRPWALIGSEIDNGDKIIANPQPTCPVRIRELAGQPIPGLLEPGYLAPYPIQTA